MKGKNKDFSFAETDLSPEEELAFQEWKLKYAPKDSGQDYDLRGAFKAGVLPNSSGHWPDTFKKPNHPTFSKESKYAVGENEKLAGNWEGENFIPPPKRKEEINFLEANLGPREGEINFLEETDTKPLRKVAEPGKAFLKGVVKEGTFGYVDIDPQFESSFPSEKLAETVGSGVGLVGTGVVMTPVGRAGATALRLGRSLTARGLIEGAVYGAVKKPEEDESRFLNAAKEGALWGAGGAVFEIGGKILRSAMPYNEKVLKIAQEFGIPPEQAEQVVARTAKGESISSVLGDVTKFAGSRIGRELPGGGWVNLDNKPPIGPKRPPRKGAFDPENLPVVVAGKGIEKAAPLVRGWKEQFPDFPLEVAGIVKLSDLENIRPASLEPRVPSFVIPEFEKPAARVADDVIIDLIPKPRKPSIDLRKYLTPEQLREEEIFASPNISRSSKWPQEPEFPIATRAEFNFEPSYKNSLVRSKYLSPSGELTPEGARNARLFEFIRPRTVEEKVIASMEKIPSTMDKGFRNLEKRIQSFIKNEVHGPVGAVVDSFAKGKPYVDALNQGLHTFARERKLEFGAYDPMQLKNVMEELISKSKLSMNRAKEILPKLDPDMPASDLAKQAMIPNEEAEAIIDELAANVRAPLGETAVRPPAYQSVPPARNVLGDEIISPETLQRALVATDVTPEQFKNAGFLRPDGTLDERGRNLLNMLNPEWRIPYTEKVIDRPPKPARVGSYGRKLEPFDINSPEGRIGLASIRSGGKGTIPLSRGTIEGFLPMPVEEALTRKTPLVKEVPGGYQFTPAGAGFAAKRKPVLDIDLAHNRRFERVMNPETGEVTIQGGLGGRSFQGFTDDQIAAAKLDYEAAKKIVIEYREAAFQWKGCPEDEI